MLVASEAALDLELLPFSKSFGPFVSKTNMETSSLSHDSMSFFSNGELGVSSSFCRALCWLKLFEMSIQMRELEQFCKNEKVHLQATDLSGNHCALLRFQKLRFIVCGMFSKVGSCIKLLDWICCRQESRKLGHYRKHLEKCL